MHQCGHSKCKINGIFPIVILLLAKKDKNFFRDLPTSRPSLNLKSKRLATTIFGIVNTDQTMDLENSQLHQDRDGLISELASLSIENTRLEEEIALYSAQVTSLQSKVQYYQSSLAGLSGRVNDLSRANAILSLASHFSRV